MMSSEHQPVTDPDELKQLKTNILDQWRRLSPGSAAALMVEQLKDLMERGLIAPPESDPFFQPFVVATVCRGDLINYFDEAEITQFTDADMERLADKMGDLYLDRLSAGLYEDIETTGKIILEEKDQQQTSNGTTLWSRYYL